MTSPALSVVLFSGTDDKLTAASTLIAGAAAMELPVHVLVQFWALDAFKLGALEKDHGVSSEAGAEGASLMREMPGQHWSETLRQAKAIGDVKFYACAQSLEMFGITKRDLDPMIDGVEGVAAFVGSATGQVIFI